MYMNEIRDVDSVMITKTGISIIFVNKVNYYVPSKAGTMLAFHMGYKIDEHTWVMCPF